MLSKLAAYPHRLADLSDSYVSTEMWHETMQQKDGTMTRRSTSDLGFSTAPEDWVLSGPHFFVANPYMKTPRKVCTEKGHYDVIDLEILPDDYLPRTNYRPMADKVEYRWAERRKLIINPVTGAMQMIQVEEAAALAESSVPSKAKASDALSPAVVEKSKPYAEGVSDHDLMALGVPPDLLERIKVVSSEVELDAMQSALPVEAYEALFLLAAGDTAEQILNARETRVDRQIDTMNFDAALQTPESQSRFVVVATSAFTAATRRR